MRRLIALAAIVVGGLSTGGCGDDAGQFDDDVAEVRAAVEAGDREAADAALEDLAIEALVAGDAGTITDAELREIADLVESSRALLDEVVGTTTTSTTSTTSTTTTTTTTAPSKKDEPDPKGKAKGRGNGGDEDDDDGDD